MFLARFSIRKLLKILEKRRILIVGLINAVLMLSLMSTSPSPLLFAMAFSLQGLSMAIIYPVGVMRIADTVNDRELVLANSLYMFGWDLAFIISPLLFSSVVVKMGVSWALAASAVFPAVIIIIMLGERRKRARA
jgi:MFS family permease